MWTQKALCLSASFAPKERFAKQSWRKFLCCLISRQLSGDTLNYELSLRTKQGKVLETQYTYVYNMVGRKYPIVWKFCLGLILVKTSMSLRYKGFCALCISWHWIKVTYRALLNCRNYARLVSYCTSTQKEVGYFQISIFSSFTRMGKQWWLSEAFYKYTWRTWRYIMSKYRTVPFQEPCRFLLKSFDQNKSFWKMVHILSMFILYSAHVSIIKRATRSSGNQCLFCFSSIRFSHVKVSSKGGWWVVM